MNQDLLDIGARLTSAYRSLSPSILGKRQAQTQPPQPPTAPKIPDIADLLKYLKPDDFDLLRKGL